MPTPPRCLLLLPLLGLASPLATQDVDQLREANRAASVLVLERLKARSPAAWQRLRRCPAGSILLVDGRHDHTDQVLGRLRLRHRRITPTQFARHSLRGVAMLIIDCPGRISSAGVRKASTFVAQGGTLLTTDWAVRHVLQGDFGRRLRHNGVHTRDDVVRIDQVAAHRFTRGVFPHRRTAAWWLENQSYPVDRLADDVTVLFSSRELRSRYRSGVVACTFAHGRGHVVHVVSHMYLQRTVHARPWERRSAVDEAKGLDLPTASPGYLKLLRSGTLGRIRAGDLNATLSVQQFLVNIVDYALERRQPRPLPILRPPRPVPIRVSRTLTHESNTETHLSRSPGGADFLKVGKHLRLEVVRRRGDWVLVCTPAGQQGWIPAAHLSPRS